MKRYVSRYDKNRYVRSAVAVDPEEITLKDKLKDLEDDFDFLVDGLELLLRDDPESPKASSIISGTRNGIQEALSRLADQFIIEDDGYER